MARRVWVDDDPFAPRDGSAGPRTAPGGSQLLVRRISLQDDAEVHLRRGAAPSGETQDPWPLSVPAIADLGVRGLALNVAAAAILTGIRKNRFMVYTSFDIRFGYWWARKFALPYEIVMRVANDRFDRLARVSAKSLEATATDEHSSR